MYSFSYLEPVCCSMSSSNCCFLTCIQVSQEAGQVVWYFHLFQNFPQFIVIHTVKGFGIVNKAEIDTFLELSCFFDDPANAGNWSLAPLPFLKPAWTSGSSQLMYCWSLLSVQFSSVQLLSCIRLFATPWITAHQAPCPSPTPAVHSDSHPSSQWCHQAISSSVIPFSSGPQSLPASVFSNESTLRMRWPKYRSFSFSIILSKEIPGLIFRMD